MWFVIALIKTKKEKNYKGDTHDIIWKVNRGSEQQESAGDVKVHC